MYRIFYAPPPDGAPASYNRIGERWVLKWDGVASNVTVSGAPPASRDGNRIVWVWNNNKSNMWVTFSGMDRNNPPHNIRLCEERHEHRLDVGEIFNPDWLAKIREASGIIRFMDWQGTNSNIATLRFSDIADANFCSYGAYTSKPFVKGGMPLRLISSLANQVSSHPWVCIPNVLGTYKLSAIATISNSDPTIVKSPGHKWDDGDKVILYGSNWPQAERKMFSVINSDQRAGTFALDIDSRSFGPYVSGSSCVTSPFDLTAMMPEVTKFAAHFRDHVASDLVTYFEFGNETWNFIFNHTQWLAAQGRAKFGRDDNSRMAGYLAAHCMKVIRETYGINGRHRWRGVLATQTVNIGVTAGMIGGIKQYIEENDATLKVVDLFNALAVTGYFSGPFIAKHKASVFDWMDISERRWLGGLEATKYSYFNRTVNEDCADGRHTGNSLAVDKLVPFWRSQKAIADANGLELIQYEGGNHNDPKFYSTLTPNQGARFMEFYKQCCHTFEDAQNYIAMFSNFIAAGGKYPSKFVEMSPVTRYGNWGGLRYLGDSNPVWDAVVAFNARR